MNYLSEAAQIGTDMLAVGGAIVLLVSALYALVQLVNSNIHNPVLAAVASDLAQVKDVVNAFDDKLARGLAALPQVTATTSTGSTSVAIPPS